MSAKTFQGENLACNIKPDRSPHYRHPPHCSFKSSLHRRWVCSCGVHRAEYRDCRDCGDDSVSSVLGVPEWPDNQAMCMPPHHPGDHWSRRCLTLPLLALVEVWRFSLRLPQLPQFPLAQAWRISPRAQKSIQEEKGRHCLHLPHPHLFRWHHWFMDRK